MKRNAPQVLFVSLATIVVPIVGHGQGFPEPVEPDPVPAPVDPIPAPVGAFASCQSVVLGLDGESGDDQHWPPVRPYFQVEVSPIEGDIPLPPDADLGSNHFLNNAEITVIEYEGTYPDSPVSYYSFEGNWFSGGNGFVTTFEQGQGALYGTYSYCLEKGPVETVPDPTRVTHSEPPPGDVLPTPVPPCQGNDDDSAVRFSFGSLFLPGREPVAVSCSH